jgi:hypothetical protein
MMLNTDLHCGKLDKVMAQDVFISLNRGIDDGHDLPREYLAAIYDDVKHNKIEFIDVVARGFDDDAVWLQEVEESRDVAAAHGAAVRMRGTADRLLAVYDAPVFAALWRPCVAAFATLIDAAGSAAVVRPQDRSIDEVLTSLNRTDIGVLQSALDGFSLCAEVGHAVGATEAVDRVVTTLVRLLPLNLRDGFAQLQKFGNSASALLAVRLLFDRVLPDCAASLLTSMGELAAAIAKMLLLGVFAEDNMGSPIAADGDAKGFPSDSSRFIDNEVLLSNPCIALPPSAAANAEGGWFSGLWGGGGGNGKGRRDRDVGAHNALLRVRSACPQLHEVLCITETLTMDAILELLRGLCAEGTLPATPAAADGYVASYVVHLVVEVVIRNVDRLGAMSCVLTAYLADLFAAVFGAVAAAEAPRKQAHSAEHNQKQLAEHWRLSAERCTAALVRLLTALAKRSGDRAVMVRLLGIATTLPQGAGATIAGPISKVLATIVGGRGAASAGAEKQAVEVPPFEARDAAECHELIRVLQTVGRDAATKDARQRAALALLTLVQGEQYHCPANVPALAEALASFAVGDTLPLSTDQREWVDVANADVAPAGYLRSPLAVRVAGDDSALYEERVVAALMALHMRLAGVLPSCVDPASGAASSSAPGVEPWVAAWRSVLHCLSAVCFVAGRDAKSKAGSDALLGLQRTLLDTQLTRLPPPDLHRLVDQIVLPLVERVCLQPQAHAEADHAASMFLPSSIITSVFGRVSGSAKEPATKAIRFSDDIQSRTASLLPKVFLHFVGGLAADPRLFLPLWQRVLTTMHTLASRAATATAAGDPGLLREAVQESVRNAIFVLTAMSQQPEHRVLFAPFPSFWHTTRTLVRPFDFADGLLAHMDSLGLV